MTSGAESLAESAGRRRDVWKWGRLAFDITQQLRGAPAAHPGSPLSPHSTEQVLINTCSSNCMLDIILQQNRNLCNTWKREKRRTYQFFNFFFHLVYDPVFFILLRFYFPGALSIHQLSNCSRVCAEPLGCVLGGFEEMRKIYRPIWDKFSINSCC